MQKLRKQLIDAQNSLTENNWSKKGYFSARNNALCMCAHGAVQAQVNPRVKKFFSFEKLDISELGLSRIRSSILPVHHAVAAANDFDWNNRPSWISNNEGRGSLDLHFLLGVVGLTLEFNDHPSTTINMIKDKFDEAIKLLIDVSKPKNFSYIGYYNPIHI